MSRICVEEMRNRKSMILGLIYERTDRGTRPAYLSYREIARHAGCSQGSAINCMRQLVDDGLVAKHPRFDPDGGQRGNAYVLVPRPVQTNSDGHENANANQHANANAVDGMIT